jgi:hypothetical protein
MLSDPEAKLFYNSSPDRQKRLKVLQYAPMELFLREKASSFLIAPSVRRVALPRFLSKQLGDVKTV